MRGHLSLGAWPLGAWLGAFALTLVAEVVHAQPPEAGTLRDAGRPADAATADVGRVDAGRAAEPPMDAARPGADATDAGRPARTDAGRTGAGARGGAEAADAGAPGPAPAGLDAGATGAGAEAPGTPEGELDGGLVEAAVELTREPSTAEVVRTLLGLLLLLALAWLGGLPGVRRLEERLGITQVVTSGLPFVLLGVLMHAPGVDVLSDEVVTRLTPLLMFGLGWIGFHTGFSFEARAMDEVPRGTGSVVVVLTSFPFALITAIAAIVLLASGLGVQPTALDDGAAWLTLARDACLLGLAGALSAPIAGSFVRGGAARSPDLGRTVAVLDDVFGVFALALLSAWLRPEHAEGWQLPGVGWLFVTLGMAATLGLVVHFALLTAESSGERMSLLLGSVAFTAGLAGYASISPLVVCFLAGVVLRNVPGGDKQAFAAAFTRLERPVYLLFLTIAGALWQIDDWRGWLLLVVFLTVRLGGRSLGARMARRLPASNRPPSLERTPDRELVLAPMGQLAIAFVVAAQTLYESPAIRAIVTAVIGGSIVSEILARFAIDRPAPEADVSEADEDGYDVSERSEDGPADEDSSSEPAADDSEDDGTGEPRQEDE